MKQQPTKKPTGFLEDLERLSEKELEKIIKDIKEAGKKHNKEKENNGK